MPLPLLRHVEEDAARLGGDPFEGQLELLAAVAAERMEDVARQALRMDADEDVLLALHLALDERNVVLAGERLAEGDGREVPVGGRQADRGHPLDELFGLPAVLDQVLDRDHLDPVPLAVRDQVGTRAIVPSSRMISQTTPAGLRPASRARSTAASVWPAR
jgi:hypothetical protein